ncbi:hypothetical protein [Rudaea sp.]|uniref:hypothetical protein n=1 Tax=Rudaea sp. TaxID=2136325 RepID=UPI00321F6BB2
MRKGISPELANVFANYAILQAADPDYYTMDTHTRILSSASRSRYADALGECLLLRLQPKIEAVVGEPLHPTYSYLRIYGKGSILDGHVDRRESEIAASMALACVADAPWLLRLQARDKTHALDLAPGDLVVYEGIQLPHWREVFQGEFCIQVIFSYVRANGEFAGLRFDGRDQIGPIQKPGRN